MAVFPGYTVNDNNRTLITPLRLGESPAEYPPPLLGVESLALRMRHEDHDTLHENGRTLDSSGFERHGHLHDEPGFIIGAFGRSYGFNGVEHSYIHVHHDTFLNASKFTLSCFVRVDGEDGGGGAHIIGRGAEATAPWFMRLDDPGVGRKITFAVRTSAGLFTASIPATEFRMRETHHIIATFGNNRVSIYKDNVLKAQTITTGAIVSSTEDMYIGTSDGEDNKFHGIVKDVRMIPAVATSTQRVKLLGSVHPKVIHQYLQSFDNAVWGRTAADLEVVRQQFYLGTARSSYLNRHGRPTQTIRKPGEGDNAYRLRIIADRRRLLGGITMNDAIEVVETVVGATQEGSIRLIEHLDTNDAYEPAYIRVEFNTQLLLAQGFTSAEIPDVRAEVEKQLNKVCAAGVRIEVVLRSGAAWDNGDNWDDPATLWGS